MKKTILIIMTLALALSGRAYSDVSIFDGQAAVRNLSVEKSERTLYVTMDIDVAALKVKSNREMWLRPALTDGDNRLNLPAVMIAGHNRYYQAQRHDLPSDTLLLYRAGRQDVIPYQALVEYQDWMEQARLTVDEDLCGCCSRELLSSDDMLATLDFRPRVFESDMVFVAPAVEAVKSRAIQGQAYIDFPVNRTEIYPDYRRNPAELEKIRQTIDVIRNDADTRITSLSIKGFASPEGPYANNERLAKGRTAALADYVRNLYSFPNGLIATSWEAEDWDGLRRYVAESNIDNRDAILAVIDNTALTPDARDWKLKKEFPEQYKFLLAEVYPALRHSDYRVEYVIRTYTDVKEIASVMRTAPQKLSLHELFVLAQSLDPGSDEYKEVFEVAVRMYPDSELANLNAANTALSRRDHEAAARYLAKAGTSPQAVYARGVCAALAADYPTALTLLQQAQSLGVAEAGPAIERLRWMEVIK